MRRFVVLIFYDIGESLNIEDLQLITTGDGSHTLYHSGIKEIYHSRFGAIAESKHIFINTGLLQAIKQFRDIRILEIGFGTGLNAWLTVIENIQLNRNIQYFAVEPYPLPEDVYQKLNYPKLTNSEHLNSKFLEIHQLNWKKEFSVMPNFTFIKYPEHIQELNFPETSFNLIYFDAFSPDIQPELWTQGIFEKIARHMSAGGILVTYSSRGSVKRNLIAAGFDIEKIPGPQGKREIIRACLV